MANTVVNPTRMELTRLKGKLKTAQRGHKLLKDKRDELMKQFLDTVRELRSLRSQVEQDLMRVHSSFTVASALMSAQAMEQALMYPKQSVELTMTFQNIMSVNVPVYHYQTRTEDTGDIFPYGFAATSGELDGAVAALGEVFQNMLKLAETEKAASGWPLKYSPRTVPFPEPEGPEKTMRTPLSFFFKFFVLLVIHNAVGHRLRLYRRKDDVVRIGDDNRPGPPSVGGVDEAPALPGVLDDPLDGSRFRADNGNQAVGRDHVSKADVDKLHRGTPFF